MDCVQHGLGAFVADAAFDANGALGHGGQHIVRRNGAFRDAVHAQAVQARHRKEGCAGHAIVQLFQAGLQVAAEFHDLKVRAAMQELRTTAERGCADDRTLGQVVDRFIVFADERIAHVFAGQEAIDDQAVRLDRWQVFGRMDRDVDAVVQHRFFDFLGEQTLVADFLQRAIRVDQAAVVAGGLDDHDVKAVVRQIVSGGQAVAGFVGLCHGQRRTAGADTKRAVGSR